MTKTTCLILLQLFLFPLCCNVKNANAIDEKSISAIIRHYFSDKAKASSENPPYFLSGDFNGDGIDDIAILFDPHDKAEISKQVKISDPWSFSNHGQEDSYHKSLVILHGGSGSWVSPKTQIFALLEKSGVLETPSFKLIFQKHSDKDFASYQAKLPVNKDCDFMILPTESGIDTYVYWDNTSYKLHIPDEIP